MNNTLFRIFHIPFNSSETNRANFEETLQQPKRVKMKRKKVHNKMNENIPFVSHHDTSRAMKPDNVNNLTKGDVGCDNSGIIPETTNENRR